MGKKSDAKLRLADLHIRIPVEMEEWLKQHAEQSGTSVCAVIKFLVSQAQAQDRDSRGRQ